MLAIACFRTIERLLQSFIIRHRAGGIYPLSSDQAEPSRRMPKESAFIAANRLDLNDLTTFSQFSSGLSPVVFKCDRY
jgi:hypothetical protein